MKRAPGRASPAQRVLYVFEAAAFLGIMGFFRIIGLDAASALGGFVARTIGPLIPVSNRARENMARAMPEIQPAERERIIRAMWDNLGRTFGEYPHLAKFKAFVPGSRITVENAEIADAARAKGKGVIFFSGHFGNWEVMVKPMRDRGFSGGEVYRATNNPYVDAWLVKQRSTHIFPDQVAKGADGARKIINILRRGDALAMLVDQKMNDGLAIPFFGRDAMTAMAPAGLAIKYGAALVPAAIVRENGAHFRVKVYPEIEVPKTNDRVADAVEILTRINRFLEDRIREKPENWLWLHRRWPKEPRGTPAPLSSASAPQPVERQAAPETN
jgi:KDO2-lipid IV(A) lauroyltransferase